ncbi:DUF1772 domain-containing protein [Micromonospora sp. WMMD558]|uniref:anthrone oxygenase family protein n=1 Tax=unclassified Micromonospora TaxID=2617518 RepID=UPI0012B44BF6|nr:anthrone oxygenase family protein [Micromonospora sp. WMMC415]QGN45919.1 DUF1772 domain-containing protein [Micromonospora sp. WMMC415]
MSEFISLAALAGAAFTSGLMAGLFFAYACSVMPGLAATDARTLVGAMQSINRKILNGWFLAAFLGAPVLTVLAVALQPGDGPVLVWSAAALVAHLVMFGVTMRVNVPLNNRLDAAGPVDRIGDLAAVRERFERPWVRWNLVRTVASAAAFAALLGALLAH